VSKREDIRQLQDEVYRLKTNLEFEHTLRQKIEARLLNLDGGLKLDGGESFKGSHAKRITELEEQVRRTIEKFTKLDILNAERIGSLEKQVGDLAGNLCDRISTLERKVAHYGDMMAAPGDTGMFDQKMVERIEKLELQLQGHDPAVMSDCIVKLQKQSETLERKVGGLTCDIKRIDQNVEVLRQATRHLDVHDERLTALEEAPQVDVEKLHRLSGLVDSLNRNCPMPGDMMALEKQVGSVAERVTATDRNVTAYVTERVQNLEGRLTEVEAADRLHNARRTGLTDRINELEREFKRQLEIRQWGLSVGEARPERVVARLTALEAGRPPGDCGGHAEEIHRLNDRCLKIESTLEGKVKLIHDTESTVTGRLCDMEQTYGERIERLEAAVQRSDGGTLARVNDLDASVRNIAKLLDEGIRARVDLANHVAVLEKILEGPTVSFSKRLDSLEARVASETYDAQRKHRLRNDEEIAALDKRADALEDLYRGLRQWGKSHEDRISILEGSP
jgi:hypothetical protein